MREEEATSRTQIVKEEKILIFSNLAMVTLCSLGKEDFVLGKLFLVREGDTVNTLEGVIVGVSQEVGSGVLRE